MGFDCKRFTKYIRNDQLHKVKSFVTKYGEEILNSPLDHKKRRALHVASKYESGYCLSYFLSRNVNLNVTDKHGNLPLHLALRIKHPSDTVYADVLEPLLKASPKEHLEIANRRGETVRHLINNCSYVKSRKKKSPEKFPTKVDQDEDSGSSQDSFYERLRAYADDDYQENMGRFEPDEQEEFKETYEEWTNRIAREYAKKHHHIPKESRKRKHDSVSLASTSEERREQKRQLKEIDYAQVYLLKKLKFTSKTKRIYETEEVIHLKHLPWLGYAESMVLNILFADVDKTNPTLKKKVLKEQQILWHPDRFSQKCNHRLKEKDREEILKSVNAFSQLINAAILNSEI